MKNEAGRRAGWREQFLTALRRLTEALIACGSRRPKASAERLSALSGGGPAFRDLDVTRPGAS